MASGCDLILAARWLATQDDARGVIENAAVAVKDGLVAAVGPRSEVEASWSAPKTLDLGRSCILPGLINTHGHAAMTVFRGLEDDLPLMDWLTKHIFPVERQLTREVVYLGSLLAAAEMIRTGTTCFTDMYLFEEETARAVDACGLRAVLGDGIFAVPQCAYTRPDEVWPILADFAAAWKGHPRIRPGYMAHSVYLTPPDMLVRAYETACREEALFCLHLAETRAETDNCLRDYGRRPAAHLEALGLLSPRSLLVHCVDLDAADLPLIAASGAHVSHCPKSNLKLASGVAPVPAMRAAGINVALGTDGAASNNSLDLFSEMGFAALLHKGVTLDPLAVPAQTALDMATRNAAGALAWPELGALAPGRAADLIALDLAEPGLQPVYNPVSQAVYAASGSQVLLTMVAGKILYRDGRFETIDLPSLLREIEGVAAWVRARLV
ncbi:MAG: amidohydrolase [Desulfovibrionaceae bacterium]|nr:amidohydrolase [Desulfovibrionaceae bacterium]MBF0515184.1 amidohydrolase [Desulfovibrionaceae bacterium]